MNTGTKVLLAGTGIGLLYLATRKTTTVTTSSDTSVTDAITVSLNDHKALTTAHGTTGAAVGTTNVQTLSNKSHDGLFKITNGTDVDITGQPNNGMGGYLVAGNLTGTNVAIDDNEIMARNNGSIATLNLQNSGGNIHFPGKFDTDVKSQGTITDTHIAHTSENDQTGTAYRAAALKLDATETNPKGALLIHNGTNWKYNQTLEMDGSVNFPNGTDVDITGQPNNGMGGYLTIGSRTGSNLALDNNEIMARNNGAATQLMINANGGPTYFGGPLKLRLNTVYTDTLIQDTHNSILVDNTVPVTIWLPTAARHNSYMYSIKKVSNNTSAVNIAALQDEVARITITNGGTEYTTAPIVTIASPTSPTGITATATSTIDISTGMVTSITITNGGSEYTTAPIITIASPASPTGTTATATASINGGNVENLLIYPLTTVNQGITIISSGWNWWITSKV